MEISKIKVKGFYLVPFEKELQIEKSEANELLKLVTVTGCSKNETVEELAIALKLDKSTASISGLKFTEIIERQIELNN